MSNIPVNNLKDEFQNRTNHRGINSEIWKPTDDELADRWINKHPYNVYGLECFRFYEQGIWKGRPTKDVENEILNELEAAKEDGIRPNIGRVNSVRGIIKIKINIPDSKWNNIPDFLPFQNGLLDLSSLFLLPPDPENYITSTLPYVYVPDAIPVFWLKAISPLPKDVVEFFQEFAGLCLTADNHYELALWLHGPSGCGKSTLIAGFQAMLGQRSISLGLRDIENSRFNLAQLNGKTLMVATEQPLISISVLDIINRIISGERMLVEDKGKDPYEMIPKAKIIWAMTELPSVSSASDGIFRRVRVVEMPPIPKEYQDLSLKDQVMQEAPGILNWAIEGLSRLRQRGKFNIPESIHLASENYKHVNDLAKQFVNDCCEIGPEYKIQAQFLYNEYKNWCENNGHKPKSIIYMANEWKRLGFDRYDANGKRYWKGIKINVSRNIQHIEEKEINILIDRPSTSSTPSTVSSTIPGEWYIPETDKN